MAAKYDFTVDQGTDFKLELTYKDDTETPIDLTGTTFQGQARAKYTDAEPAFTFVFTLLDQTTNPGRVDVTLPKASTQSLTLKIDTQYFYDFESTLAGNTSRDIQGVITISPEATK